jgi:hypothetical protein
MTALHQPRWLADRSRTLLAVTGVSGIASLVLRVAGQALMQSGVTEPAFDAPADEIQAFFEAVDAPTFAAGSSLSSLSIVTTLWFVGGLFAVLRRDWRAPIAFACGLGYALSIGVGWELAAYRVDEGIDPQLSRLAFDLGILSFAASWVALGGYVFAVSWALRARRIAPRWLSTMGSIAGLMLVAARAAWETPLWVAAYLLFLVWMLALCFLLIRGAAGHPRSDRTEVPVDA